MTKTTRNAAPSAAITTEELLAALPAREEVAPEPVPSDVLTLPAGPLKLAILLPANIAESRQRGKVIPVYLVYVIEDGKLRSTHYAHSLHGPLDTFVNLKGTPPSILPNRLPDTSGTDPSHFLPPRLDWWLQTEGAIEVHLKAREVTSVEALGAPPVPMQSAGFEELPAIPQLQYTTPGIAAFVEACEETIIAANAGKLWGRAVAAAHQLAEVANTLSAVDKMPASSRKPGSQFDEFGVEDAYPSGGSAIVQASGDTQLPTAEASEGYVVALRMLASRALDRRQRVTCERGGEQLATLRDSLRDLMA